MAEELPHPTWGDRDRTELFETRLGLAEIKGMLSATLTRHDQRLDQHESTLTQHDTRLNEKGKLLARHDERIKDLEEDNSARLGRVSGVIGVVISVLTAILAISNRMALIP